MTKNYDHDKRKRLATHYSTGIAGRSHNTGKEVQESDQPTSYQRRIGYPAWGLLQDSKLVRCSMVSK
jgi:hypothetical protein